MSVISIPVEPENGIMSEWVASRYQITVWRSVNHRGWHYKVSRFNGLILRRLCEGRRGTFRNAYHAARGKAWRKSRWSS